jgi:hypothetical protein
MKQRVLVQSQISKKFVYKYRISEIAQIQIVKSVKRNQYL